MPDELHRVEWRGNLAGQYRDNVMHWRITGATNDTPFANSNALVQFLHTSIRPSFMACLPPDYSLDSIFARRIGPTTGQYASVDYAAGSQPGGRASAAVSEQLCPCITLIPPMGVKSAGRIFLPAVAKTDINLNVPLAGYVTVVNTFMNACIAGGTVAGGSAIMVIYSRKLNTNNNISGYHLSPAIGYQRRRSHPVGS
jgi:hypothetical protein